jgi:hypothetical protein
VVNSGVLHTPFLINIVNSRVLRAIIDNTLRIMVDSRALGTIFDINQPSMSQFVITIGILLSMDHDMIHKRTISA